MGDSFKGFRYPPDNHGRVFHSFEKFDGNSVRGAHPLSTFCPSLLLLVANEVSGSLSSPCFRNGWLELLCLTVMRFIVHISICGIVESHKSTSLS